MQCVISCIAATAYHYVPRMSRTSKHVMTVVLPSSTDHRELCDEIGTRFFSCDNVGDLATRSRACVNLH